MKRRMSKNDKKILSAILILIAFILGGVYLVFAKKDIANPQPQQISRNDNWTGDPYAGVLRIEPVFGKKYMISTASKLASQVGAEILAKGGNAIDATIAAQMVLNVVEPQSSGIGGGGFLLYYDAKTKKSRYFNGRETAPSKANGSMFLDADNQPRSFEDAVQGGLSVGTPGLLKMLKQVHSQYGKLPWKALFQPAIKIAEDGFVMDVRIYEVLKEVKYLKNFGPLAKLYLQENGEIKEVGTIIKNPALAKTFSVIAKDGIESFYQGKIARDIVNTVQKSQINPGFLSLDDLKNYQVRQGELICGDYRVRYKICSMPLPSSGGITLLQIMGILENFDLPKMALNEAATIHLVAEATRLAYLDRNKYLADMPSVPVVQMLDKNYLQSRSKMIKTDSAMIDPQPGQFKLGDDYLLNHKSDERPSTTHLSVVDADGNAVSMTSSIEYLFGSGLMVDGFMLNNQLTDFSFLPEVDGQPVANRVEPRKQPRSSMTPVLVFDDKSNLRLVIGSPGGPRITQFVARVLINNLDGGIAIQDAISMPNYVILQNVIELEKRTELEKLQPALQQLGHEVKITDIISGLNAVAIDKAGNLAGGADPRRWGSAIGE